MATIKYTGFSHFRELLAEDFKKLGVEGQKALTFARHEATEVKDDVAEALLQVLGDEFEKVKEDTKAAESSNKTKGGSTSTGATGASGPA